MSTTLLHSGHVNFLSILSAPSSIRFVLQFGHSYRSGGIPSSFGSVRPQNLQTIASPLIISAQYGHFFIPSLSWFRSIVSVSGLISNAAGKATMNRAAPKSHQRMKLRPLLRAIAAGMRPIRTQPMSISTASSYGFFDVFPSDSEDDDLILYRLYLGKRSWLFCSSFRLVRRCPPPREHLGRRPVRGTALKPKRCLRSGGRIEEHRALPADVDSLPNQYPLVMDEDGERESVS